MSGIRAKGRRGFTVVPNWRWEDPTFDPHELRIAGWLASHAGEYTQAYVTRNEIARRTGISQGKVSAALTHFVEIGLVDVETVVGDQGRRLVVTFDFDAWSSGDQGRSSGDHPPGHVVTDPRSSGDHLEEQKKEDQEREQQGEQGDASVAAVVTIASFDAFWTAYPKKTGKGEARIAWGKLSAADRRAALDGAIRHANLVANNPGVYVLPDGPVWLNKRRWEDDEPRQPPAGDRRTAPGMDAIRRRLDRTAQ